MNTPTYNIKYPMAIDEQGQLVSATLAPSNRKYICIDCESRMVVRKGEKIQHHFAHFADTNITRACSPESAIHKAGKRIIAEKINQGLLNNTPVIFSWVCPECQRPQTLNIIGDTHTEKVVCVGLEQTLTNNDGSITRPDIVLSGTSGKPIMAVEIINTHAPESKTLLSLSRLGVSVFGVNVLPEDNLLELWQDKIPGQWFIPFGDCQGCLDAQEEHFASMDNQIKSWEVQNNGEGFLLLHIDGRDTPEVFHHSSCHGEDVELQYYNTVPLLSILNNCSGDWFTTDESLDDIECISDSGCYWGLVNEITELLNKQALLNYCLQLEGKVAKKAMVKKIDYDDLTAESDRIKDIHDRLLYWWQGDGMPDRGIGSSAYPPDYPSVFCIADTWDGKYIITDVATDKDPDLVCTGIDWGMFYKQDADGDFIYFRKDVRHSGLYRAVNTIKPECLKTLAPSDMKNIYFHSPWSQPSGVEGKFGMFRELPDPLYTSQINHPARIPSKPSKDNIRGDISDSRQRYRSNDWGDFLDYWLGFQLKSKHPRTTAKRCINDGTLLEVVANEQKYFVISCEYILDDDDIWLTLVKSNLFQNRIWDSFNLELFPNPEQFYETLDGLVGSAHFDNGVTLSYYSEHINTLSIKDIPDYRTWNPWSNSKAKIGEWQIYQKIKNWYVADFAPSSGYPQNLCIVTIGVDNCIAIDFSTIDEIAGKCKVTCITWVDLLGNMPKKETNPLGYLDYSPPTPELFWKFIANKYYSPEALYNDIMKRPYSDFIFLDIDEINSVTFENPWELKLTAS